MQQIRQLTRDARYRVVSSRGEQAEHRLSVSDIESEQHDRLCLPHDGPAQRRFKLGSQRRDRHPANSCTALLAGEVLVNRELVDFRRTPGKPDGCHRGSDAFRAEPVEVLARFPEVDDTPTAVYWSGRVKDEPVRRIAVRVDRRIESVNLLGRTAGKLQTIFLQPSFLL